MNLDAGDVVKLNWVAILIHSGSPRDMQTLSWFLGVSSPEECRMPKCSYKIDMQALPDLLYCCVAASGTALFPASSS